MSDNKNLARSLYDLTTDDEDARACRDIPDDACREQTRNFSAYFITNMFGKIADELASTYSCFCWHKPIQYYWIVHGFMRFYFLP